MATKKGEIDRYEKNAINLVNLEKQKVTELIESQKEKEKMLIMETAEVQRKLIDLKLELYLNLERERSLIQNWKNDQIFNVLLVYFWKYNQIWHFELFFILTKRLSIVFRKITRTQGSWEKGHWVERCWRSFEWTQSYARRGKKWIRNPETYFQRENVERACRNEQKSTSRIRKTQKYSKRLG